ncbi:H-NS family nucleoid-associated regulatory protein [Azospirillum picis]|uniref:H-NS histone family protein n=1 Tax=Azospirillum picis TaxID=488438 RepID=A0ABU0MV68_9PROT|nr:H-NS family nucleoid-associated regulatory protein [Azospirillum picis]MBP2303451.1 hypothetical protein [Azospirillum picis]MDQ0537360.1 hypothetical protein [Azospirillum picis]
MGEIFRLCTQLSVQELFELQEWIGSELDRRKSEEVERLKAEVELRLKQLNLSLGDVFPDMRQAVRSADTSKPARADLEAPEKGATYRNPEKPQDVWTAGVKKGRAPVWVDRLREKGELHRHKVGYQG